MLLAISGSSVIQFIRLNNDNTFGLLKAGRKRQLCISKSVEDCLEERRILGDPPRLLQPVSASVFI
uniref:Uncharacterized protein n=1 Tax=Romanomermis culicivorax TaxID=13658 RepID=A0A915JVX8_ROMCU